MSNKIYDIAYVYKIFDKSGSNHVYIGSTGDVEKRILEHEADFKRYLKGKYPFVSSFEVIKLNNFDHEVLEVFNNISKSDLRKKETEYIKKYDCVNKSNAYRSVEEKQNYNKIYRQQNRDKLRKWQNEKFTCDVCHGKFTRQNRIQHENSLKHMKAVSLKTQQTQPQQQVQPLPPIHITIKICFKK